MTRQTWPLAGEIAETQRHPNMRPRDAATIILYETSGSTFRVLFGRRHSGHVFMANAYVFPGGRLDAGDSRVPVAGALHPIVQAKLMISARGGVTRTRAFAVAAIRELAEETGLCLGVPATPAHLQRLRTAAPSWAPFAQAGLAPDLSRLSFIARAITPPRIVRRYDTRFFAAEASEIRHRIDGIVGPAAELTELIWLTLEEARAQRLPPIVRMVLDDLAARLRLGLDPAAPVPFYRARGSQFARDWL